MELLRLSSITVKVQRAFVLKEHGKAAHLIQETLTDGFPVPWFSGNQIVIPDTECHIHLQRITAVKFQTEKVLKDSNLRPDHVQTP